MYRDLAHLEGEREDQAIRTIHLALYVISAALQTQKIDEYALSSAGVLERVSAHV